MDGPTGDGTGKSFDARPYLRRIQSRGGEAADYLDVKWRLVWLRMEHPDARISTEHVMLTDSLAVFRASVEIPGGGSASGYGSQTSRDFPEFIEAAETKAIGRALAALGFGTQFARDFDLEEETTVGEIANMADAPVEPPAAPHLPPSPRPIRATEKPPAQERPAEPRPIRSVPSSQERAPTRESERGAARTATPAPPAQPAPARREREPRASAEPAPDTEFDRANYDWNQFWRWARELGYRNKSELESLLGIDDLLNMTPREARHAVVEFRRENGLE